jgi:O-acetylserine/cysteine efflux transporter
MMKGIEGLTPLQVQAWAGASSMIALTALSAWLERDHLFHVQRVGWTLAAAVSFSAIVVSVLSQTLYYYLLRRHPISVVSPLMIIATLLTVVLGIVVTGDPFDLRMSIGAAFAICGVLVVTTRPAASAAAEPHRRVERA